jgi:DNA-binding MarR family transcriptional regulator
MAEAAELTEHLGYWLRIVSNHVSHSFARKLEAKHVTVAEWVLMRVLLGRATIAPSQLADEMGMTRGAISKLADRLIEKALIAREPSRHDGRSQTLRLTKRGQILVPELAALADCNEVECFAHLSRHDKRDLQRILKETVARLGLRNVPVE